MKNELKFEEIEKLLESANLNFLIGSGASKPFLETLQDVEKVMDAFDKKDGFDKNQTDKKVLKIIEASIKNHYFTKCIENNLELLNSQPYNKANSFCDKDRNKCKVAHEYKIFLESLQTILSKRSNNYPKQVNLFTTNIDVFLDVALEECSLSFNDGFSGRMNPKFGTENFHNIINKVSSYYDYQSTLPLFNLFKLHGSLNWKYNKDKTNIYYDNQLSGVEELKKCNLAKGLVECFDEDGKFLSKKDAKDHGFAEIYREAEKIKDSDSEIEKFITSYDKLAMINPNKDKFKDTTLKLHYYELLRMFSNNIDKENAVLFVFGFSFADEHICEIVNRAIKSNPTLLVVIFAYSEDEEENISERVKGQNVVFVARFTKEEKGNRESIKNFDLATINKEFFEKIAISLGKSKDCKPVVNVVVPEKKNWK